MAASTTYRRSIAGKRPFRHDHTDTARTGNVPCLPQGNALPLDDCLYALQLSLPHLTRATLHRLYRRHGISRLSDVDSPLVARFVTQAHIPGDFYLNVAPVRTGDGIVNIYVAFDRVSRIAFAELHSSIQRTGGEIPV